MNLIELNKYVSKLRHLHIELRKNTSSPIKAKIMRKIEGVEALINNQDTFDISVQNHLIIIKNDSNPLFSYKIHAIKVTRLIETVTGIVIPLPGPLNKVKGLPKKKQPVEEPFIELRETILNAFEVADILEVADVSDKDKVIDCLLGLIKVEDALESKHIKFTKDMAIKWVEDNFKEKR